jgi:hypothetical protein
VKVYVHKDHECYSPKWCSGGERVSTIVSRLTTPWDLIIKRILKGMEIPHSVIDFYSMTNSEIGKLKTVVNNDDILVARFAHSMVDKKKHEKIYPVLNNIFTKIFPNKISYSLIDNKILQYEFLINNGFDCIEYDVANNIGELKQKIFLLDNSRDWVIKSTSGAGSESVFLLHDSESFGENNINKIDNNSYFTYPCVIQPYIDHDKSYKMFLLNDRAYILSLNTVPPSELLNLDHFPYGYSNDILWYDRKSDNVFLNSSELYNMKNEILEFKKIKDILNTPILIVDFCKNNNNYYIFEYSVISGQPLLLNSDVEYYDMNVNKIFYGNHKLSDGFYNLMLKSLITGIMNIEN